MVELKIQCPTCKHQILVRGKSSEKISIACPQCNTRGEFTFPLDASTSPVQNERDTQRPLGVTILALLAIFYALTNIFKLLSSASLLNLTSPLDFLNLVPPLLLLLDIVVSAVFFIIAYAFWKGLQWSWFVAIILLVIEIIDSRLYLLYHLLFF